MRSIKDYAKTKEQIKNNTITKEASEEILNEHSETVNNLQESLNKYQNLSQDELMTELFKEAGRLKQNGSLNENSLNMLQNTLAPMLNNEQNKQLKDILNRIK